MANALEIAPESGLETGGFELACSAESFLISNEIILATSDFFVTLADNAVSDFAVSFTDSTKSRPGIHLFTFTAPPMAAGTVELVVGLIGESNNNVSFTIRIDALGNPYLTNALTPSQCYSQGGGTVTATIADVPVAAIGTAPIVIWDGTTNVSAEVLTTGFDSSGSTTRIRFPIPSAQMLHTHTQSLSIVFDAVNPPATVVSSFI